MLLTHTSNLTNVPVRHEPRQHGSSNYNLKRSMSLALNLFLSYSSYPLYAVAAICALALVVSLAFGLAVVYRAVFVGTGVPGWASVIVILTFFNALSLFCLFIFGIYLSRISQQISRQRVSYTIGEML